MAAAILTYYAGLNFSVGLAYLIFKLARQLPVAWSPSFGTLNRLGIALLTMALSFPPLFGLLPARALPNVSLRLQAPLAESPRPAHPPRPLRVEKPSIDPAPAPPAPASAWPIAEISLGLLVLGAAVLFARLVRRILRLRALIARAFPVRELGRVRIRASDEIQIPFATLAAGAAHVLVPTAIFARGKDLQLVLRHELQHHRNGDTRWAILIELVICALFPNPFIYFWKNEMIETQELACDETLIRQVRVSARAYGGVLIRIAEEARGRASMQVGTTCMGAGPRGPHQLKSFLGRRIEVFQRHQSLPRHKSAGLIIGTIGACLLGGAALASQKTLRASAPNAGLAQFDPFVQTTAQEILDGYVRKFGAQGGFVIVADPRTGKILAAAQSLRSATENKKSWILSYAMEPASLVKPLVFSTVVERGFLEPGETIDGENGQYHYGGRVFEDWKKMKLMTAVEVVTNSSNIGGIKLAEKLGPAGLEVMLQQFGFGPKGTAEKFPEAAPGVYPHAGELPETEYVPLLSTGYAEGGSFAITPLEMVQAYSAFANDGKLMQPLEYARADGDARIVRQAVSKETAEQMKNVLAQVVREGTGRNARSELYTTAGKTSTAYHPASPEHHELGGERGIAGFIGFAPVGAPRLVVYAGIFDPTSSKDKNPHGNEHAAPVFRDVIEKVLQKWGVPADR